MINEACSRYAQDLRVLTDADPVSPDMHDLKIAIQIHVYFADLIPELVSYVSAIPCEVDCYISTDSEEKAARSQEAFLSIGNVRNVTVAVYENRGRDVAPFLAQLAPVINEYDLICHIHTKKSETVKFGDGWRHFLLDNLLGSKAYVARLLSMFCNDPELGIAMPESYPVIQSGMLWSGARADVARLLEEMHLQYELPEEHPTFPAGDMFWARVDAVAPLFALGLNEASFPDEAGQTNYTLAHAVERIWCYLAQARGFKIERVFDAVKEPTPSCDVRRLALFVHFDISKHISSCDLAYLEGLKEITTDIVVISNGGLDEASQKAMAPYVSDVFIRGNVGYDFGAWNHALHMIGAERLAQYDEIILCNNSCVGPIYSFSVMFDKMSEDDLDFWGITLFPSQEIDETHDEAIPEHLQSYFIVFKKDVFLSKRFWEFWDSYKGSNGYLDTVLGGESRLTQYLAEGGYTYGAYLPESLDIGQWLGTEQPQNELGLEYALLGSPLIKKKNDHLLPESRRKSFMAFLEGLSCERCITDFFVGKENALLKTLEVEANEVQERWREEPLPARKAPSVESQFWFVAEDYTVALSDESCRRTLDEGKITLNWLIPPFAEGPRMHELLFRIMSGLEARGFHSKAYLYADPYVTDDDQLQKALEDYQGLIDPFIDFSCDVSSMGFSHISIATEWQNACFLRRFDDTLDKVYLLQDYEPMLPPKGSVFAFIDDVYSSGLHPITAGTWVRDMLAKRYGKGGDCFSYAADHDVFYPRSRHPRGKRVLFYADPKYATYDFELGVLAIAELCKRQRGVSVELIGKDLSEYVIPFKYRAHDSLSAAERAQLYSECDLCIFLSSTNLLPLAVEAMACGSVVVCSDNDGSRWIAGSGNAVLVPEDPKKIADVLERCLIDPSSMNAVRAAGLAYAADTSWDAEIDEIADALRRRHESMC